LKECKEGKKKIKITNDKFTKNVIEQLYMLNIFEPNIYNSMNPKEDYQFLLEMKTITDSSDKQIRKANYLIGYVIKPYLKE
jgi:hypothetical protein